MSALDACQRIGVVVVGYGRMGRLHARTLAGLGHFEVLGVVDCNPECEVIASSHGFKFFPKLETARVGAALAIIAAPSSLHAGIFATAAAMGMDCLVEKPVGMSLDELEFMANAAKAAGVRLFAGYSERFNPSMNAVIDAVKAGPCRVQIRRRSGIALRRDMDSDVMHDLLAHDIDWLVRALGAEPVAVDLLDCRYHEGSLEDLTCELHFPGNVHVNICASRIADRSERSVTVDRPGSGPTTFQLDRHWHGVDADPLTLQAEALAQALRGHHSSIAGMDDAFRVQRILSSIKAAKSSSATSIQVSNAG